jgi:hypothetical protein
LSRLRALRNPRKPLSEDFSIYTSKQDKKVMMLIGVTQTIIEFGAFLKKKAWSLSKRCLEYQTSRLHAGINTRFKPALKGLYGDVSIVEMYGATEGMYAQQINEMPFVVPNYDVYFFEVETKKGVKMLYELERGEIGSLIISSCLFPRYKIGDLIKCGGRNYYTVIGREERFTRVKHFFSTLFDVV